MPLNKLTAIAAICGVAFAGCGNKETQMILAIQETLDALGQKNSLDGSACLPLPPLVDSVRGSREKPSPVFEESGPVASELAVLTARGLLQPEAAGPRGTPRLGISQEGMKYLRYERTSYFATAWNWALCTGAMKVSAIENYTKPADMFGQTVTTVHYRYAIDGVADWAKDPQVQALNPRFARHFQQPVGSMDLVQTNKGWRSIYMQQREAGLVR